MILDKEVRAEQYAAKHDSNQGKQVETAGNSLCCGSLIEGTFLVLQGQDLGNAAFGARRVAGGDNNSRFKTSSSEVGIVNLSGVETAWSWSTPSGNFPSRGKHCERESGIEIQTGMPTDFVCEEGVENFDSLFGVDNLGEDYENPVDKASSGHVDYAHDDFTGSACGCKTNDGGKTDQNNYDQISPATSRAVGVAIFHNAQTTKSARTQYRDLATKKGTHS